MFDFVTYFGGAARSTIELGKALSKRASISIVDAYGSCDLYERELAQAQVPYKVLYPKKVNTVIGAKHSRLRRLLKLALFSRDFIIIRKRLIQFAKATCCTHIICINMKSLAVVISSSELRRRVILGYLRGWYTPDMLPPLVRLAYKFFCNHLLAISWATKNALICSGIPENKITVVYNFIDVREMEEASKKPLTKFVPGLDHEIRLLLPAYIVRDKGQHIAIQALQKLHERHVDAVLWIAGDVPPGQKDDYVKELNEMIAQSGLHDRVFFLGDRRDIPQLIRSSTIVILPSATEGLPRTVMEAMSLMRPVISTRVGGVMELIHPNLTGFLMERDAVSLRDKVLEICRNGENKDQICENARTHMLINFSSESQVERIYTALASCISKS